MDEYNSSSTKRKSSARAAAAATSSGRLSSSNRGRHLPASESAKEKERHKQAHMKVVVAAALESWSHQILYHRRVYPRDSFCDAYFLNLRIKAQRHPRVVSYIDKVVQMAMQHLFVSGVEDDTTATAETNSRLKEIQLIIVDDVLISDPSAMRQQQQEVVVEQFTLHFASWWYQLFGEQQSQLSENVNNNDDDVIDLTLMSQLEGRRNTNTMVEDIHTSDNNDDGDVTMMQEEAISSWENGFRNLILSTSSRLEHLPRTSKSLSDGLSFRLLLHLEPTQQHKISTNTTTNNNRLANALATGEWCSNDPNSHPDQERHDPTMFLLRPLYQWNTSSSSQDTMVSPPLLSMDMLQRREKN